MAQERFRSIDPTSAASLQSYPTHQPGEVERRLSLAADAFKQWRDTPIARRAALMDTMASALRADLNDLGSLMTREMGKPISASKAEVEKCAWVCEHYAVNAETMLRPRPVKSDAAESSIVFEPLGAILAIMPWNFPLWQVYRCAVPALMAGNVVVLKHAPNVMGCALRIEALFEQAGFPEGVFTNLLIAESEVEAIISDDRIAAVSLTGSVAAGRAVAAAAGRAIKKTVLELGGSDPFIVLRDADMPATVTQALHARTMNCGQSCIAAKRFLVERPIAQEFERQLLERLQDLVIGDPMLRETDIGPLARPDLRDTLHDQVERSVAAGARLVTGGQPIAGDGYFYEPTVLADVRPGMPVFDEETFGPVHCLTSFEGDDEAVALANHTRFGLGASIWCTDLDRARQIASRIESGSVFVNDIVRSDPRLPFGGIKQSGYGRELGDLGMLEFVNAKTLWVG